MTTHRVGSGGSLRYYFSETKRIRRTRSSWLVCELLTSSGRPCPICCMQRLSFAFHSKYHCNKRMSAWYMSLRKFLCDIWYAYTRFRKKIIIFFFHNLYQWDISDFKHIQIANISLCAILSTMFYNTIIIYDAKIITDCKYNICIIFIINAIVCVWNVYFLHSEI